MHESSTRQPGVRWHLLWLLLLLVLSWGLRLYELDAKSVWSDEGLSIYRARQDIAFILTNQIPIQDVVTKDTQPPLYFLLLHGLRAVAGESEFALRFLSACFATLIIPMLYTLGKRIISPSAGLFAALLGAASPTYLWYAQEIRMYTLLVLVSLLSTYCLLRLLSESVGWRRSKVLWLLAYLASSGAMVYTHYSGFFLLIVHAAMVLVFVIHSKRWRMAALMVLAGLAATPLLPFALRRLSMGAERDFHFVPLNIILLDLLNGFAVGIPVDLDNTVVPTLLGTLLFALGVFVLRSNGLWGRRGKAFFLLAYLLLPVITLYAASFVKPMYMGVRHLLIVSPAYFLGAGAGLSYLARERARWMAAVVIVALLGANIYATHNHFRDEAYVKDDLRGMFGYVRDHYLSGDIVVLNDAVLEKPLAYYAPDMAWTALPHYGDQAGPQTLERLAALTEEYRRIWYVFGPPSTYYDPEQIVAAWLDEHLFRLDFRRFPGYTAEVGVFAYASRSPLNTSLSDLPALASHSPETPATPLHLADYELPASPTPSGDALPITLYWWLESPMDADYKVSARLLGPEGTLWAQADSTAFVFFPMTEWPIAHAIRHVHEILLPPGTPPGTYQVELRVYHPDTGEELPIFSPGNESPSRALALGNVQVGPAARPVDPDALPPHNDSNARFQYLTLVAHTWHDREYEPNDVLHIDAYWRLEAPTDRDHTLLVEMVSADTLTGAGTALDSTNLSTANWPVGQIIRSQHNLILPADIPPGTYLLRAKLWPYEGKATPLLVKPNWWAREQPSLELARMTIRVPATPTALHSRRPAMQHELDVKLGEAITLLGYDLDRVAVQAGDSLALTLYWECRGLTDQSYAVFTHVIDDQEKIWGQKDSIPVDGKRPTSSWRVGEVLVDQYDIPIKSETPPGTYLLTVGMYDPVSLDRLPPLDAGGTVLPDKRIELQPVEITD